jgi:formate C-acetyltransferase
MEPFYQADKAAGLVDSDQATFMLKNLFIKLNEIGYYYGEAVALQNSADLGQSISLGGFTEDGEDATAEMDYLVLDAMLYLRLPQPPLTCIYTDKMSGKFLEKVFDVVGTGIGMPQFVNGDVMITRALNLFSGYKNGITIEKARRTCIGACVGSYIPYETGHPVEGQPNLGKVLELTLNNGFDARTKTQVGPKSGDPGTFKNFEELYAAFEQQLKFTEDTLRHYAWISNILCAEFLPVTWRSILTGGCIESGTEVWNGGANYYTTAQIVVAGVDAANGLMAVKKLVFDEKKLTMAELKEALDANFEGEYEKVRKMCFEAPKHGNDIPEVNKFVRRVYNSIYEAFQNVGGNYMGKEFKSAPDAYTKSIHNMMGLVTGALPTGKKAGVALTDGSLSAMPGTDTKGPTALVVSAAKGQDAVKYTATHMNMKIPPDQLKTRKGRQSVLSLIKTLFDLNGYHIQFSVMDTETLRDAQKHPEKYRDLVVRVAGFSAFFTKLHPGVQDEIIARTEQEFGLC